MANAIVSTDLAADQEKFLQVDLIRRSKLKLVMKGLCSPVKMMEGAGTTMTAVRYKRMNVPLVPLEDGVTPPSSTFSIDTVTVDLDQWGDYITITDKVVLTTSHPLVTEAMKLLADNAARVMDREVTNVCLAGTNVSYGDGTVLSRASITSAMVLDEDLMGAARVTMVDNGVPPIGDNGEDAEQVTQHTEGLVFQGNYYVAVCGPSVIEDIKKTATSLGTWAAAASYQNFKLLSTAEVGMWRGFRWVETNFIPKFTLLGNTTVAVASGASFGSNTPVVTAEITGGTLTNATTYYYKVTRIDLQRGFEEQISIAHSTSTGVGGVAFDFDFSAVATGYAYRIYFGTSAADADLKLCSFTIDGKTTSYIPAGTSGITVGAVPANAILAPSNIKNDGTVAAVHLVFMVGADAINYVDFYNTEFHISRDGATNVDPLNQRKTLGYKFFGKAMIRDQQRLLRLEVASLF